MSRFAAKQHGAKKPFSWSYSKLKNFETCPKRHFHVDVAKDVKEEESEQLAWGNEAHKALAKRIEDGTALPPAFSKYEHWISGVTGEGNVSVELQLAINAGFQPVEWFAKDAWYRGIADVLKINGPVALAVDWKTGKVQEDSVQLALMAQCVFAHYPQVQAIRTEFVWLKHDCTSREDFRRSDMPELWAALAPRLSQLEHAYSTGEYPPKPGFLCRKYCPVDKCAHHGG